MVGEASATITDAVPAVGTVSVAEPLFPSLVAMMLAEPAPTAVTKPVLLTVATAALLDTQATVRPVSTAPLASVIVAVACVVPPIGTVEEASDTVIDATGGTTTVRFAVPLFPSLEAVMPAVPAATAVTTPAPSTVATPELLDDQVMARPVRTLLLASLAVALALV
jgi:hypothetical protein